MSDTIIMPQDSWFEFNGLATDISHRALLSAKEGIYPQDRLRAVSPERLRRYCLRGEGESEGLVQIHPRLLELIRAHRSTIVFVNSRILCERIALALNAIAGEEIARALKDGFTQQELDEARRGLLSARTHARAQEAVCGRTRGDDPPYGLDRENLDEGIAAECDGDRKSVV